MAEGVVPVAKTVGYSGERDEIWGRDEGWGGPILYFILNNFFNKIL